MDGAPMQGLLCLTSRGNDRSVPWAYRAAKLQPRFRSLGRAFSIGLPPLVAAIVLSSCAMPSLETEEGIERYILTELRASRVVPTSSHTGRWTNKAPAQLIGLGASALGPLLKHIGDPDAELRYNIYFVICQITYDTPLGRAGEMRILDHIEHEPYAQVANMGLACAFRCEEAQDRYIDVLQKKIVAHLREGDYWGRLYGRLLVKPLSFSERHEKEAFVRAETVLHDTADPKIAGEMIFSLGQLFAVAGRAPSYYELVIRMIIRALGHGCENVREQALKRLRVKVPESESILKGVQIASPEGGKAARDRYLEWWEQQGPRIIYDGATGRFRIIK